MNLNLKHNNFFLLAGPCAIENREHSIFMVEKILNITNKLDIPFIYKSSFEKANRSSLSSYHGIGIDGGLEILKEIKTRFNVPIITDVHETNQIHKVAEVADIIQIPAFLCRQTPLLLEAGRTGKWINIKKGQLSNHLTMKQAYDKVLSTGNNNIILTDRGNMYGYDDLVVDYRNLVYMRENKDALICMDVTHSLQQPNRGIFTHGQRDLVPYIARAAVAVGIDGLFMEVHNDPQNALCDSATQLHIDSLEPLLTELINISNVTNGKTLR